MKTEKDVSSRKRSLISIKALSKIPKVGKKIKNKIFDFSRGDFREIKKSKMFFFTKCKNEWWKFSQNL